MKVWQLCDLLEDLGYTLPVLGNVTGQSVGGVVSTGTHGKNKRFGTISSLVQSMRLVLANGEIKNIAMRDKSGNPLTEDPYACVAGVSMGLLGVISTVTLRVVPKHRLSFAIDDMSFDEFIDTYDEVLEKTEHVCFLYFPFGRIRIEISKKLTDEEEKILKDKAMPRHNRTKLFFVTILNYVLFESVYGRYFGPVVWLIIRYVTLCDLKQKAPPNNPAVDKSWKVVANNVDLDIEHHEVS